MLRSETVEQIVRERTYPELKPLHPPRLKLSPLLLILVVLLISFAIVNLGMRALAQYTVPPPNPFPAYADIFPGQSAEAIETRAFSCDLNYNYQSPTEDHYPTETYCTFVPAAGVFSRVGVVISSGIIRQSIFVMRDNTFRVGDLAIWLEAPVIHFVPKVVYFALPRNLVRVTFFGHAQRFSLFLPVSIIAFTDIIVRDTA
jgi:hypothetical protein